MHPGLSNTTIIGDPVTKQDISRQLGKQHPFHLMRADVRKIAERIGYTKGCKGCKAAEHNYVSRPMHSDECRIRMETEMRKTPRGSERMQEFEHRLASEVEARVRQQESGESSNKQARTQSTTTYSTTQLPDPNPMQLSSDVLPSQSSPTINTSVAANVSSSNGSNINVDGSSSNGAGLGSGTSIHVQGGTKRPADDAGPGDGAQGKRASIEHRGEKRQADGDPENPQMSDWLSELLRVTDEACSELMVFEPDWATGVGDDVVEIFSPPRIITVARRHGLKGEWSVDRLTEFAPGEKWDLSRKSHQKACLDIIDQVRPGMVVGSPPCTWFSQIMRLNWPKIPRWKRRQMMAEARAHLEFSCKVYQAQYRAGRVFIHEHPSSASSWEEESITKLMKLPGIAKILFGYV